MASAEDLRVVLWIHPVPIFSIGATPTFYFPILTITSFVCEGFLRLFDPSFSGPCTGLKQVTDGTSLHPYVTEFISGEAYHHALPNLSLLGFHCLTCDISLIFTDSLGGQALGVSSVLERPRAVSRSAHPHCIRDVSACLTDTD